MFRELWSLDDALEYIDGSELVEVTPKSVRIRKIALTELESKRSKKGSALALLTDKAKITKNTVTIFL